MRVHPAASYEREYVDLLIARHLDEIRFYAFTGETPDGIILLL